MSLTETISQNKIQDIIAATDECVMCGLCLPHCPTYSITKTETESPRGRIALIRALHEGKLDVSESITSHLDHCLTCMSCERACPANVDYEKIIDAGRALTHHRNKNIQQRLLLSVLGQSKTRKALKVFLSVFKAIGLHRVFSKLRTVNLLPDTLQSVPTHTPHNDGQGLSVAILNSCAADLINDQTLNSANFILSKLGCNVIQQKNALCCGALHQHSGDFKTAESLRSQLLQSIETSNIDHIVSLATGCSAQIKRYPKLEDTTSANEFSNKLIDINELVLQQLEISKLEFKALPGKVYIHKPCTQPQVINHPNAIERLLTHIPNIEILHFNDPLACCGAGGINTLHEDKLADQFIENKIHELKNSPASYLVSSNIGCALHFQARLKRENIHVQICHPITLLAQQVL